MLSFLNRNLFQPLLAWRQGSSHLRSLRELERTQFDDPEVIAARQTLSVKRLLVHAYETVPFYRDRFDRVGFHPSDFRTLEDLELLPVLTKADLRKSSADLVSEKYLNAKRFTKKTSGSTGVPLEIQINPESMQWKAACTLRSDQWSGWRRGSRVAKVWGNPEYRSQGWKGWLRNRLIDRAVYLDTLDLDETRIEQFVRILRRHRPGLIFGHAHSLYLVACHVKRLCPEKIRPDGIISTAMILHDWQREVIEEAFSCKVTNRYGCEEVSLIASECSEHHGLHLNCDSIYAEVQPDFRLGHDTRTGQLLVTDLTNLAMPLIRYQIGDVVVKRQEKCPCGRGLPLLERVIGREADFVLTPNGRLISGISLTENFALHIPGTAQVQLVQESRTFLRIRIVPDDRFTDGSRFAITRMVQDLFGKEMKHEVELVDSIPQEKSGKYRFCISPVAQEYLRSFAA
jgi:phenylacetate-CoA ligase